MQNRKISGSVAVYANLRIKEKREVALEAVRVLLGCGLKVRLPAFKADLSDVDLPAEGISFCNKEEMYKDVSLAVVVGGDGTVLDVARCVAGTGVPILGINMGRVGYMTELEPGEIGLIPEIIAGAGRTDVRSMLKLTVNGREPENGTALNDIVISNSVFSQVIDVSVSENGSVAGKYRADGIIFSTATGSTAYNVAAGGPVIDPRLSCIAVTPICPHTFYSRPTVFPADSELEVSLAGFRGQSAGILVDGQPCAKVGKNDAVSVTTSEKTVGFIRIKPMKFYQTLHKKNEF